MAEIIDKEKYGRLCQAVQQTEEDPRDQMYPRLWQLDDGNRFTTIEQFKSGSLHNIGVHYCTDKAQANRTAETSYLQIYEMYFQRFKEAPIDMVEIGVRSGQSINAWNKYFSNANSIYGIDIAETWWESLLMNHIHYVRGDATEPAILDKLPPAQEFDIIIDDGSHINEQIIKSFEIFYPRLKSGGIYVIEDLYNSYGARHMSSNTDIHEILGSSSGIKQNKRADLDKWLRELEAKLNNPHRDVFFIHHWDAIIVIGKV